MIKLGIISAATYGATYRGEAVPRTPGPFTAQLSLLLITALMRSRRSSGTGHSLLQKSALRERE